MSNWFKKSQGIENLTRYIGVINVEVWVPSTGDQALDYENVGNTIAKITQAASSFAEPPIVIRLTAQGNYEKG